MTKAIIYINRLDERLCNNEHCDLCGSKDVKYKVSSSVSNNILYVCILHSTEEVVNHFIRIDFNVRNSDDVMVLGTIEEETTQLMRVEKKIDELATAEDEDENDDLE